MKLSKHAPVYGENITAALGLSALSSITATIVLAAIIAFLMNTEKITDTSIGYSGMGILLGASFAGAITAEKRFNGNRLLAGLLSGVVYFLILIGVTTLFFEGGCHGVWANALMILCGSGIAVIFGKPAYKAGKGRSVKKRSGKVVQKRYIRK